MFKTNKLKNERSVVDITQSLQDMQLMMEITESQKYTTDSHLRELSKGLHSAMEVDLEASLKRRQISKVLLAERKQLLRNLTEDLSNYCLN
jgi:uncharacterized protein YqiB (DUF1249 family)